MKTLLLKLAGPLQSWGTSSHFENRYTDFHPSKSAIIGMIAASLGYRRDDDENINKLNDLDFAVRIDQTGKILRDFHIAKLYKANGDLDKNYVTNRYYLEDAIFVVALSHEDDSFMSTIIEGLKNPYFQPFLGRRSLPLNHDFILDFIEGEPIQILENYSWQAAEWVQRKHKEPAIKLEVFADGDLMPDFPKALRKDRVVSFAQKERKFLFRYEANKFMTLKNEQSAETTHDIFDFIGD